MPQSLCLKHGYRAWFRVNWALCAYPLSLILKPHNLGCPKSNNYVNFASQNEDLAMVRWLRETHPTDLNSLCAKAIQSQTDPFNQTRGAQAFQTLASVVSHQTRHDWWRRLQSDDPHEPWRQAVDAQAWESMRQQLKSGSWAPLAWAQIVAERREDQAGAIRAPTIQRPRHRT